MAKVGEEWKNLKNDLLKCYYDSLKYKYKFNLKAI
jgi:hypothetical protein